MNETVVIEFIDGREQEVYIRKGHSCQDSISYMLNSDSDFLSFSYIEMGNIKNISIRKSVIEKVTVV